MRTKIDPTVDSMGTMILVCQYLNSERPISGPVHWAVRDASMDQLWNSERPKYGPALEQCVTQVWTSLGTVKDPSMDQLWNSERPKYGTVSDPSMDQLWNSERPKYGPALGQ